jgi:flavin reductase (DIM6/NTAB) family NADH-FMN oxidoreductase RutF
VSRSLPEPDRAVTGIGPVELRRVCARFATGVAVATVIGQDNRPYGLTINSFTSVSAVPPLILICIDYRASALVSFRSSSWFGVNILSAEQQPLSDRFASYMGDRFATVEWTPGPATGAPLLADAIGTLECCVSQVVEAGDHAVFFAEVVSAACAAGDPLLYYGSAYGWLDAGKKAR